MAEVPALLRQFEIYHEVANPLKLLLLHKSENRNVHHVFTLTYPFQSVYQNTYINLHFLGGLIVGSLGVFFGIISLAVWSVVSINLDAAIREIDDPEVRNSLNEIRWLLITLLIIYIISAVLTIIVSALLIYGTVKVFRTYMHLELC